MESTLVKLIIAVFIIAGIFLVPPMISVVLIVLCLFFLLSDMLYSTKNRKQQTYIIKKGHHYSSWKNSIHFKIITNKFITGDIIIDPSMIYEKIPGWNKIVGFSGWGNMKNPYHNSIIPRRLVYLVWRCDEGELKLGAYCRDLGSIEVYPFNIKIYPGEKYVFRISENVDNYVMQLMNIRGPESKNSQTIKLNKTPIKGIDIGIRKKLFPYFGGREPAPHDVRVDIYS